MSKQTTFVGKQYMSKNGKVLSGVQRTKTRGSNIQKRCAGTSSATDTVYDLIQDGNRKPYASAEGPTVEAWAFETAGCYNGGRGTKAEARASTGRVTTDSDNEDDDGKIQNSKICEVGAGLRATIGRAETGVSVFSAYAEGPCAGANAGARHVPYTPLAEAKAGVELSAAKIGVKAGPAFAEANLNINMNAKVGTTGVEANFLGFGFSIGAKTSMNTPFGSLGFSL